MLKTLLVGAAITVVLAAGPALAQPASGMASPSGPIPLGQTAYDALPSEPVTPEERAAVRRDWNEMAREWEARQRSGTVLPQSLVLATKGAMPMSPSGLSILPSEPVTPQERAAVRRDWNEMAREWEARQRSGIMPPQSSAVPTPPSYQP